MSNNSDDYAWAIWGIPLFIFIVSEAYVHRDEITIYQTKCSNLYIDGICKGTETTLDSETYKVSFENQTVIRQLNGEGFYPVKLSNCTVMDQKNWACNGDDHQFYKDKTYVQDGDLETDFLFNYNKQISKWKWHYLRAKDWVKANLNREANRLVDAKKPS